MPAPPSRVVFDIRRDPPDCEVRPKQKLAPRRGDTVRIETIRLNSDGSVYGAGSARAKATYVPGFVGELSMCDAAPDGWHIVHFQDSWGGVFAQVTVLERELVDGNAPQRQVTDFKISEGEVAILIAKKPEPPCCYWCGEPKGDRAFAEQRCGSCGTSDDVARVATPLYRQRLDAGGLNDCHAERMAAVRRAEQEMRPACAYCGSKEGLPDGYGTRRFRNLEQRALGAPYLAAVCITCVQRGFDVLSHKSKSFEKQEPEPGAAPHWPAQHSSPGWED